ncbi:MAG: acetyl-CoA carboxylase biotin carboxyl carrier protein [Treponema sp.]|nr:acetyl-CoA carboxylase biotin carboxyl carrier protein [Treponema sp.]
MNEQFILQLLEKFSAGTLAELDIQEGSLHILLRKESAVWAAAQKTDQTGSEAPASAPRRPQNAPLPAPPAEAKADAGHEGQTALEAGTEYITSPMVATFYVSPGPDAPAFVNPGSRVKAGDTLCILEAMKMMNHMEADFACEIRSIRAANGELVEYGQALFEIRRI